MLRSLSRMLRSGEATDHESESKNDEGGHEFELPSPVPEICTLTEEEQKLFQEKLAKNDTTAEEGMDTVSEEEHALRKMIEEELGVAAQDHKDDKVFLASSRIQKLHLFLRKITSEKSTEAKSLSAASILQKMIDSDPIFKEIMTESERARKFLRKLESEEGWEVSHRGKKISSFWKEEKDSETYSFKVMGVVHNPILNLIPLLLETDLYPNWFPMMASAEELFSGSRFHKVVKSTMKMPFPLRIRECIIDGKGYDVMEHNRVVVSSHSISEHPRVNIGQCPEDRIRVDISVGGFELIPVGNQKSHVTVMFNLNPHIPYLPSRIANFFLKHVVNQIHSSMEKHSTFKKDSPYLKRMAEKADLYNYIEKRYEETRKLKNSIQHGEKREETTT